MYMTRHNIDMQYILLAGIVFAALLEKYDHSNRVNPRKLVVRESRPIKIFFGNDHYLILFVSHINTSVRILFYGKKKI